MCHLPLICAIYVVYYRLVTRWVEKHLRKAANSAAQSFCATLAILSPTHTPYTRAASWHFPNAPRILFINSRDPLPDIPGTTTKAECVSV